MRKKGMILCVLPSLNMDDWLKYKYVNITMNSLLFLQVKRPLKAQGPVVTGNGLSDSQTSCSDTHSSHAWPPPTDTYTLKTENIQTPEVGRSGAEWWDPANSTWWLGWVGAHTHTHTQGHFKHIPQHAQYCQQMPPCTSLRTARVTKWATDKQMEDISTRPNLIKHVP